MIFLLVGRLYVGVVGVPRKSRLRVPPCKDRQLSNAPIISIVDDDESVRVATVKLVRVHGFAAHGFASAEEFLRSPRAVDTSCVITDVRMPGMSGVDLQSHLIAQGRRIPMIFITAFRQEGTEARAMAAGAICFLTKPFDGGKLISCLTEALKGDGPSD
jgi:FixJ family two-component response regulator